MDIARQISKLNDKLKDIDDEQYVSYFLLKNPQFRSIIKRVWTMSKSPMGEIQENVIAKNHLPMDLLRAKLSFLGATKFDPRSDRWVCVTFFQNAPLPDDIHTNEWLFPLKPTV